MEPGTSRPRANSDPPQYTTRSMTDSLRKAVMVKAAELSAAAPMAALATSTPTLSRPDLADAGRVGVNISDVGDFDTSGEEAVAQAQRSLAGVANDLPIREVPAKANEVHAASKKALESARNLRRDIRDVVAAGLQELYNMILRLADSRSRHENAAANLRAERAKEVAHLEGQHSADLKKHLSALGGLAEKSDRVLKEMDGLRKLFFFEVAETIKPMAESSSVVSDKVGRVESTLKNEVIPAIQSISGSAVSGLTDQVDLLIKTMGSDTYADKVRRSPLKTASEPTAQSSHTLIISSRDKLKTSQQVLEQVTGKVDARKLGVGVERLRTAKNQKVVLSCSTKGGAKKMERAIQEVAPDLVVADAARRLPQIKLKDVMASITDDQIEESIRRQNSRICDGLDKQEGAKVRYRLKARNPLQCHVILEVTPALFGRLVEAGKLCVGWQRCWVEERTPLVQCGKCLGFAHTRGTCKAELASSVCAYCAKPGHESRVCPDRAASPPRPPVCANCAKEKMDRVDHSAFGNECPLRAKWEAIAKASVIYC